MKGVLADVEDPASGTTLLEAWSGELQMLGSGSDYAGEGRRGGDSGVHQKKERFMVWRGVVQRAWGGGCLLVELSAAG